MHFAMSQKMSYFWVWKRLDSQRWHQMVLNWHYISQKKAFFSPVSRKCAGEYYKTPQTLLALNTFKANIEIAPHHTVVKRQNCTNSMPKKSLVFVFVSFSAHYTIWTLHIHKSTLNSNIHHWYGWYFVTDEMINRISPCDSSRVNSR